jgi:ketosteroid isomerase-like protein
MSDERRAADVDLIRRGLDAFNRGDTDAVLEFLDEDVEVYMPSELPNSGTYRGHDGYLQWVDQWLDAWEGFTIESAELEPVGERHVVGAVHQSARGKGSGIPVEMSIAYLWEVRDGKAAIQHLYATPEEAVAVAKRREGESPE